MQSVQESKQELEAAIRYAENAISSAKTTIESMEFRQQIGNKLYKAQEEQIHKLMDESVELKNEIAKLKRELTVSQGEVGVLKCKIRELKEAEDERVKDVREDLNDQIKLDEEVRQGINDFLDYLDDIGYERA